jgi:hypothetical protein
MFALLSYALARRDFSLSTMVAFWMASILGILSHLSFVIVSVSFVLGSVATEVLKESPRLRRLIWLLAYHVPPLAFFGLFYIFFAWDMAIGAGPLYTNWDVITQSAILLFGFPQDPFFGGLGVLLLILVVAVGSYALYRNRDERWLFFCSALFIVPMLVLLFARPKYLYFRYFIVCFPFFYLLLSYLLCHGYRYSKPVRAGVIAVALLMFAGQTYRVVPLLELGRGSYRAALTRILENSPEGVVRIGSDHDFRNRVLVDFYAPFLGGSHKLRYIPQPEWRSEPPEWILTHSQDLSYEPPPDISVPGVGVYQFFAAYPFSGVSGWSWFLYRRNN